MHHASKNYKSSLRINDHESICLVHFIFCNRVCLVHHWDSMRMNIYISCGPTLRSGSTLCPRVGFLRARLAKVTCRTAYYWNLRIFRKGQSLAFWLNRHHHKILICSWYLMIKSVNTMPISWHQQRAWYAHNRHSTDVLMSSLKCADVLMYWSAHWNVQMCKCANVLM